MRIETVYQEGLKKLIKKHDLDEINVVMLCSEVNSNRQTFYYHFRDISDVVESIMLKEELKNKSNTFEGCVNTILAYLNENYQFISAINKSFCSTSIQQYIYRYFYKNLSKMLDKSKKGYQEIIRNVCTLFSNELCYWISTKRKVKQTEIIKRFNVIWKFFSIHYIEEVEHEK